ncbi:MAG: LolA family protein [Candidatus Aminicenantales bacterium]
MKRWIGLLLILVSAATASAVTPDEAVLRIENRLRSLNSLEADFEHFYYSMTSSEPLVEKGRFYFLRPDWMRWDSREPEKQTFLYKEGVFLFYIPEDNQLIRSRRSKDKYESGILAIFSGTKGLGEAHIVEAGPFPTDDPNAVQVKLTPREEGEFAYLLLEADSRNWLIRKAVFFDQAGNKQEFIFSRIKVDPKLPRSLFELEVPPDCEIIEEEDPSQR